MKRHKLGRSLEHLEQRNLLVAPVAVDDTFNVAEDNTLLVDELQISAGFNGVPDPPIVTSGAGGTTWDFLDEITNGNNGTPVEQYPTDGAGRAWNDPLFDVSTSTASIGAWEQGAMPFQSGNINALPGEPNELDGIGNPNTVSTYLFRTEVIASGAQGAETTAAASILCDDGCIGYINGIEAFRMNMDPNEWDPPGPLTAQTQTGPFNTGNENGFTNIEIDLTAVNWQPGANVIAIELHQADDNSSDIGIDFEMSLGEVPTDGFDYADGVFGTTRDDLSSGELNTTDGFGGGGALQVFLAPAGFFGGGNRASSGGWSRQFDMPADGSIEVSVRHLLFMGNDYDGQEYSETVLTIDGVRYGNDQGTSLLRNFGNGNGGPEFNSGWQQFTTTIPLTAGSHTITLGVFNNTSGNGDEFSVALFDDVEISIPGGVSSVLANDFDDDGDPLTASFVVASGPQNGTLDFRPNGSFTYTPDLNYHGADSFRYVATGGGQSSNQATVTINVSSVNDPPAITSRQYNANEDTTLNVDAASGLLMTATDVDNPPGDLSALVTLNPANGSVTVNADGSFVYTPNLNFTGLDTFRYAVTDGTDNSSDATVSINVAETNDPPVASDDSYTVEENMVLVADGQSQGGTETLLSAGSTWRYLDDGSNQGIAWLQPAFDDSGWAQGAAELGYGDFSEVTVVNCGPDAPNCNFGNFPTTYFRTTFNVADANAVTGLTTSLVRDDGAAVYINGVEVVRDNLNPGAAFDEFANFFVGGNEESTFFDFPIDPSVLITGTNTIAVEIHQSSDTSSDISFDLALTADVVAGDASVLVNDFDPEDDPFTAVLVDDVSNGTLTLNADGTFTYTPNTNFEGVDTFTYMATNASGDSNLATSTITVTPGPNDIPVANDDAYNVDEDDTLVVNLVADGLLDNDTDGDLDPLTASVFEDPANGSVSINLDGTFTYTPNANFFGVDTFTYRAWDGSDFSAPATVSVTVNPLEDDPIAVADHYFAEPDGSLAPDAQSGVLANDDDPDGDSITASLVSSTSSGGLLFSSDGSFTYTPNNGFLGTDSFTYQADDGDDLSEITTVTITVDGQPVAADDGYQVDEDNTLNVLVADSVLNDDTDPEDDPLTAVVISPPSSGFLSLSPNGSFTYTPNPDFFGQDTFQYAANDGDQNSDPATVTITVNAINDPPVATEDLYDVVQENELVVDVDDGVLDNDSDVDNVSLTAQLAPGGDVQNGTLALSADGSFSYTPNVGFIGLDTFTYIATDGDLDSAPTNVTINVSPASQLIVINEIMYHPASEIVGEEYIELTNLGIGSVSLDGWRFDRGIDFTFPDISIAGGDFLVIAADLAAFSAKYPGVTNVIGGWTGQLSNSSEEIELEDSFGNRVDRVTYADEGDWALRRQQSDGGELGWVWVADHDGDGSSLELINPLVSNRRGQNWAASTVAEGTPGAANSVAADETAPLIWDVSHSPAVPMPNEEVTVVAKLADEMDQPLTAQVFYRVSTQNPGPFLSVPMFDDGLHGDGEAGDGEYGATLPPQVDLTVVEFYVSATDGGLTRTWPAPSSDVGDQEANLLYIVDENVNNSGQPL